MYRHTLTEEQLALLADALEIVLDHKQLDGEEERAARKLLERLRRARPNPGMKYVTFLVADDGEEEILKNLFQSLWGQ